MITNERQYRITRSQASKFELAIEEFDRESVSRKKVDPRILKAERDALESQLESMRKELREYERLKSDDASTISVDSLEQLAQGLIQARIAGGLSQRALAQRLGLKEQQIQRYEAEGYASASYRRLCQVARALDLRIENEILLPSIAKGFAGLLAKVGQVGLSRQFVLNNLLSSEDQAIANKEVSDEVDEHGLIERTTAVLTRIFGWKRDNIFGAQALSMPRSASAVARFKMPKCRNENSSRLFAEYSHYVAVIALKGMEKRKATSISTDPGEIRAKVLSQSSGSLNLRNVLYTVWDSHVVVLPLRGSGAFHSACWRHKGRNAIVLKQTTTHESRWIFDLLHELYHVAQQPEDESFRSIEASANSVERAQAPEECAADRFAADVMLNNKAEDLVQLCVTRASRNVSMLKAVVPKVAKSASVDTGALANYMAFRLSNQGINWWGAATNLQPKNGDPWSIARDVFFERHPFKIKNEIDRTLLTRALN